MRKLSEAQQSVIESMQARRERIRRDRLALQSSINSQKSDALYLVDQGDLGKSEISLYAGVSRVTLDAWIHAREHGDKS